MQASTLRRGSAAVAFALATGFAPAATFSQAWFFGDSLTDSGAFSGVGGLPDGSRWTTNNAPNHADVLATALGLKASATNPLTGYNPAGNNYAQGGAQSVETANPGPGGKEIRDLPTQISDYFKRSGGKADPNALYFVWTGGNDIPAAAAASASGGTSAAQASIAQAAGSLAGQLGALKAAGAKLIIAPNLPAFGNTPAALYAVLQGATGYRTDMPDSQQNAQVVGLYRQLEAAARQGLSASAAADAASQKAVVNNVLTQLAPELAKAGIAQQVTTAVTAAITQQVKAALPAGTPQDIIDAQVAAALKANLATQVNAQLPGAISANLASATASALQKLNEGYASAQGSLNQLTQLFNASVDAGIAQSGANVVRPDVAGLFAAVLANPKAFGVDNVTGSQCAGTALTCSTLTPSATTLLAAPSFLFADDRHPTPLTHQVLGDYFANILAAPAFADALGQVPLASRQVIRDTLHAHARALDAAPRAVRSVGAIVGGGFGRDHVEAGTLKPEAIGTLGFDYQATPELALGVAFSGGKTRADIGSLGSYKGDTRSLSAIGNWRAAPLWVDGEVFLGNTDLDTRRNIKLGPTYRAVQTASTRATQMGFDVNGGYRMQWGKLSTGPQAGLRYEHVKVGALIEDTLDFSAMRFGEQKVKSLVGSLGWNVATTAGRFSPYARVGYYHEFKGDARDIEAGLLSTAGNFTVEGQALPKNWGELGVGSALNVAPGVTAFAQATGSFARDDGNFWGVNVGLNATF
ncbi:autotransporter domain-containing protein [Crenobacter intestini]|uniref:Autotransporter domain-containing protein n=1 Tax=Crenobacter intestini TaxID=2563443 RepID=A0A4T0UKU9_9NEIS|nr:autotransporter domain-containing protein [Crenobacter intestini]TIC79197.1 autotransporter domain-containing protein [Crenobacter intestini]